MTGGPVVAVTGATGFLGAHIAASLGRAGARLRLLTHRQPPHPLWRDAPAEIISGSILDASSCARLVAGAGAVVHAAALTKAVRDGAFSEVNVRGAANMARATRESGPATRFVLISSLAAREPNLSAYAASKRAAELAVQAVFADAPGRLVILRPPAIYGPWDRETLAFFKAAGGWLAPDLGAGRTALIHVADAAEAVAKLALADAGSGCFALSGPDFAAYTLREVLREIAITIGANPRFVRIPGMVLRTAGAVCGWQARLARSPVIFTAGKARELLHPDWTVAPGEALPLGIFRPVVKLREGIRQTADWYKHMGWLP